MQGLNDSYTGYVGYRVYMVCKAPLISSRIKPTHWQFEVNEAVSCLGVGPRCLHIKVFFSRVIYPTCPKAQSST